MTLYHATNSGFQPGEALVSLLSQVEKGWISDDEAQAIIGRWEADDSYLCADGAMVSLTADLDEARNILAEWNSGEGIILAVGGDALKADGLLRTNAEGYPAVQQQIDTCYILGPVS